MCEILSTAFSECIEVIVCFPPLVVSVVIFFFFRYSDIEIILHSWNKAYLDVIYYI